MHLVAFSSQHGSKTPDFAKIPLSSKFLIERKSVGTAILYENGCKHYRPTYFELSIEYADINYCFANCGGICKPLKLIKLL